MKMNSKGQVLICFVLILPIVFMVFALVINLGLLSIEKRKITNTIKNSITYGLKHIDDENIEGTLRELIKKNIDDIDELIVFVDNNYISVKVSKKYNGILKYLSSEDIKLYYNGNIRDSKIIIKEE